MKKLSTALLLAGLTQAVSAQSSVTIYGVVDASVRHLTNADAAGKGRLSLGSNGIHAANRIGFKGVEDLGGGLNAHFTLESGFNSGTGTLDNGANILFNRTAAVGIGGEFGSIDLGRQYTVAFKTIGIYEPLNYRYPSITLSVQASAGIRNNNDIQYTGTFGPLTARAGYALGEVAGSSSAGSTQAIGIGYTEGQVGAGLAYTKKTTAAGFDYRHYTLGGDYKFGSARLVVGYVNEKQDTATVETTNKYAWVAGSYNFTPSVAVTTAYYRLKNSTGGLGGDKDLYMLVTTYALSKRSSLYAGVDRTNVSGTQIPATSQTNQTGITVGMNHFF